MEEKLLIVLTGFDLTALKVIWRESLLILLRSGEGTTDDMEHLIALDQELGFHRMATAA